MALAPLGFTVDTGPVAKAVADLGKLTDATQKAQQETAKVFRVDNSASQFAQKIDNSAQALKGFEAIAAKTVATAKHVTDQMQRMTAHELRNMDIQAYGAAMDALREKINPVFAASKQYERSLEELDHAQRVGAISSREHGEALNALNARYQSATQAANEYARAAQFAAAEQAASAAQHAQQSINAQLGVRTDFGGSARAEDVAAYGRELDALRGKFNPIFAASKRYEQELNELNRAHKIGAINTAEHGAALLALNGRYQAAATGAEVFGAQTRMAQQHARNLAFQFQDIGTMLAMGQSPFMLLAQQLPQVTMYGGRLNGVMGALKQTVSGLFSPLGLLTTGFVLAASAAISYFTSSNDEAEKAEKVLQDQESLIERVADRWGDAIPALREYAEAIKAAREAADLQTASQIYQNSQLDQARQLLPEINAELSKLGQQAGGRGWGSALEQDAAALAAAYDDVYRSLLDATRAVEEGEDATEALNAANDALARLLINDAIPAVGGLRDALGTLTEAYGIATEAAQEFNRQQAVAAAQEANRGRFNMTGQRLSQDGTDPLSDNEFLSRFGWDNDVFRFPREKKPRKARKTDAERAAERYDDMIRQSQQFIAAQELEQRALFMTEEAANALRYEQELLNQAANDNIKLTLEMSAELRKLAVDMAATEAETTRLQEALKFGKDLVRGFMNDLRSGLEQGKGFWESFGNAALNALDKIVDKLLNDVIDALFQVNNAGSNMSGGGILGFLGGLLGIGGGLSLPATAPIPTPRPFSAGGYTGPGAASQPAGIVHAGEYVFSKAAVDRIGLGYLEGLHSSAKGYMNGGYVRSHAPANLNLRGYQSGGHVRAAPSEPAQPAYQDNRTYKIDARGAQAGVGEEIRRALIEYDREVLPARVNQIAADPHARG